VANTWYAKGLEAFAKGEIDWVSDDIRVVLVDGDDYTPNFSIDDFLDDIAAGARVATMGASLAGKTATDGYLDADDVTFTSVSGDQFEWVVFYKHTGVESTSTLLFALDTGTGLPFTPDGSNIQAVWDNGVGKIARL